MRFKLPTFTTFILIAILLIPINVYSMQVMQQQNFGIKSGKYWFIENKIGYIMITDFIEKDIYQEVLTAFIYYDNHNINRIKIIINSRGGDVFYSMSIAQLILSYNKRFIIETHGTGIVSSGATLILMSGTKDYRFVYENTILMIHHIRFGDENIENNDEPAKKLFDMLNFVEDVFERFYLKILDIDSLTLKNMLREETWFLSQKAIDIGMIDKIIDKNVNVGKKTFSTYSFDN